MSDNSDSSDVDDNTDIYGDLFVGDKKLVKVEAELKKWKAHCNQLSDTITQLQAETKELKQENAQLKTNISTLIKTAQTEVQRKDKMIAELRREKDSLVFRRGPAAPVNIQPPNVAAREPEPPKPIIQERQPVPVAATVPKLPEPISQERQPVPVAAAVPKLPEPIAAPPVIFASSAPVTGTLLKSPSTLFTRRRIANIPKPQPAAIAAPVTPAIAAPVTPAEIVSLSRQNARPMEKETFKRRVPNKKTIGMWIPPGATNSSEPCVEKPVASVDKPSMPATLNTSVTEASKPVAALQQPIRDKQQHTVVQPIKALTSPSSRAKENVVRNDVRRTDVPTSQQLNNIDKSLQKATASIREEAILQKLANSKAEAEKRRVAVIEATRNDGRRKQVKQEGYVAELLKYVVDKEKIAAESRLNEAKSPEGKNVNIVENKLDNVSKTLDTRSEHRPSDKPISSKCTDPTTNGGEVDLEDGEIMEQRPESALKDRKPVKQEDKESVRSRKLSERETSLKREDTRRLPERETSIKREDSSSRRSRPEHVRSEVDRRSRSMRSPEPRSSSRRYVEDEVRRDERRRGDRMSEQRYGKRRRDYSSAQHRQDQDRRNNIRNDYKRRHIEDFGALLAQKVREEVEAIQKKMEEEKRRNSKRQDRSRSPNRRSRSPRRRSKSIEVLRMQHSSTHSSGGKEVPEDRSRSSSACHSSVGNEVLDKSRSPKTQFSPAGNEVNEEGKRSSSACESSSGKEVLESSGSPKPRSNSGGKEVPGDRSRSSSACNSSVGKEVSDEKRKLKSPCLRSPGNAISEDRIVLTTTGISSTNIEMEEKRPCPSSEDNAQRQKIGDAVIEARLSRSPNRSSTRGDVEEKSLGPADDRSSEAESTERVVEEVAVGEDVAPASSVDEVEPSSESDEKPSGSSQSPLVASTLLDLSASGSPKRSARCLPSVFDEPLTDSACVRSSAKSSVNLAANKDAVHKILTNPALQLTSLSGSSTLPPSSRDSCMIDLTKSPPKSKPTPSTDVVPKTKLPASVVAATPTPVAPNEDKKPMVFRRRKPVRARLSDSHNVPELTSPIASPLKTPLKTPLDTPSKLSSSISSNLSSPSSVSSLVFKTPSKLTNPASNQSSPVFASSPLVIESLDASTLVIDETKLASGDETDGVESVVRVKEETTVTKKTTVSAYQEGMQSSTLSDSDDSDEHFSESSSSNKDSDECWEPTKSRKTRAKAETEEQSKEAEMMIKTLMDEANLTINRKKRKRKIIPKDTDTESDGE